MREPEVYTLPNGIRIAHGRINSSQIVHCGIMFDIGSRDERQENQGIAHFWEHLAFKGTRHRSAFHILNRLETVGGELNAFTDKEKIMFYASVRTQHFERAAELLTDIAFHSSFPVNQISRERKVILEEMAMYYDEPDGALQDEFDQLLFGNHPMGMNILGTERSISSFSRRHFLNFIQEHLDTGRVIFSVVGDLSQSEVMDIAKKYLEPLKKRKVGQNRMPLKKYTPRTIKLTRPVKQARCAIGRPVFSIKDDRRIPLYFLNNILGGPGMNSRLNLSLREKRGYVYSVGSQYAPMSDTGIFVVSFGTDPTQMEKALQIVYDEMDRLADTGLTPRQLKIAREQFLGQMAMAEENHIGFMMMMARNLLDVNSFTSFEEITNRIKSVTPVELKKIAAEVFNKKMLSCLIMQPSPES